MQNSKKFHNMYRSSNLEEILLYLRYFDDAIYYITLNYTMSRFSKNSDIKPVKAYFKDIL